jgi:TfoX/Sxy family transcriptional regulator of competence genes
MSNKQSEKKQLVEMENQLVAAAESFALELEFKPMFGGVCAYVESRVFASLSNVGLALKLSPLAQTELLKLEEAKRLQYETDSTPSKQYIVVPPEIWTNERDLAVWLKQSVDFVTAQPALKPRRKRTS